MADAPASVALTTRDLEIRCAWLYYVEGQTQDAIARALRLSRAKVLRLLASAREAGVVRIRVDAPAARLAALETMLVARFGLRAAVVVESRDARGDVAQHVGVAAGRFIATQLRDGFALGVGWGATLSAAATALAATAHDRMSVISLLGGMTRSGVVNPAAVARRIADTLHADCYQVTAPLVVAHRGHPRGAVVASRHSAHLRERARRADCVLVSCGDVDERGHVMAGRPARRAPISPACAMPVRWPTCSASSSTHAAYPSTMTSTGAPSRCRSPTSAPSGTVVLASGGVGKVGALAAALKALRVDVLVTDAGRGRGPGSALNAGPRRRTGRRGVAW